MTTPARWYIVHVYSGFEKKVAETIKERAMRNGLTDHILEILVPMETITEIRRGKKHEAESKFLPGYVLVKMIMTDDTWHLVKDTPRVTGFLGEKPSKPTPISEAEVERIMQQVEKGVRSVQIISDFDVGENVRVADGPFVSFNGIVEEIDEERQRLKVSVYIFGRATPVELNFSQVEKIKS